MLESFTAPEIERWLHLRAIEWAGWPSFITQPIVPVLLIFYPWYWIIGLLFVSNLLWSLVRCSFVSPRLAQLAVFFVFLKWPATLISAAYLFYRGSYVLGIVALIWPLLSGIVGAVPGKVGVIEVILANKVGYIDHYGNVLR